MTATPTGPIVALIVAAGRGSRMAEAGDGLVKQYVDVGGAPILVRTLQPFLDHPGIHHVQVVIHPEDRELYREAVASCVDPAGKLCEPVDGGTTRQQSALNGLDAIGVLNPARVLIHDAARPFLSAAMIDDICGALHGSVGAIPALEVADTLKRGNRDARIVATVSRTGLHRAQTPQGFHYGAILRAHQTAAADKSGDFTDDASIAEAAGIEVVLVSGDENLRKITTPADIAWARDHVNRRQDQSMPELETRVGQGFDVHAFAEGDGVTLLGIHVPFDKTLSGHSDADVGLHALTDAILGALGDGDIGTHFPPSDPQWKGADSVLFLQDALRRVRDRGGQIRHVDVTLICEQPKIGPHRETMTERLSNLIELSPDRISIKATTTERLGFPGRSEGIAALAIATVALPV